MTPISEVALLSDEAKKGDIFGIVRLYNITNPSKPESSADRVLSITYPSNPLVQALKAIHERLTGKRTQGTFIFAGGYGTGKSHCLLAIFHLLTSPILANEWLTKWSLKAKLPPANVVALQLMEGDEGNPEFLWEPLFKRLGKASALAQVRDFPTISQLKRTVGKQPTVIILDELESWYESIAEPVRKTKNLNFLQVLSEVSSDSDHKLITLASLYGKNREILGRLGREQVFIQDLTGSEDKADVIRFRLFQDVDKAKARSIVQRYIKCYTDVKVSLGSMVDPIDQYRNRMLRYYPLHPELLEVLFQSFGASRNYQNTRGILYLLSSVLRKSHTERDILLPADVNPENEDVHDDLFQLDPHLVDNCLQDVKRNKDERLARGILAAILLRSFITGQPGANEAQIVLSNITPETNINEIHRVLSKLQRTAWFLHRSDGRYVVKAEENLPVSINARAERLLAEDPKPAQDKLAKVIKSFIKGMDVNVYPLDSEIPDTRQLRVVVSTTFLDGDAILENILRGREWRNTVIFINPKTGGDLAQSEEILLRTQRILVCESMDTEVTPDKKKSLVEYRQQQEDELKERIRQAYGDWMKASGKGTQIHFRPVTCELSTENISERIIAATGAEVVDDAILAELKEAGEEGRRFDDLKSLFLKQAGRPLLLDSVTLPSRIRSLHANGEIVIALGKRLFTQHNLLPEVQDEMTMYLAAFAPSPTSTAAAPGTKAEKPVTIGDKPGQPQEGITTTLPLETVGGVEEVEIIPAPRVPLVTQEHTTPFKLVTELESRLSSNDRIASISISLRGTDMEEPERLEKLLAEFKTKGSTTYLELHLKLPLPSTISRDELLKLLGKLPVPSDGIIQATLEVEKREPR